MMGFFHHVQEFIEEILSSPFGGMIAFVKEAEALMEKGQLDRLKNEEGKQSLFLGAGQLPSNQISTSIDQEN